MVNRAIRIQSGRLDERNETCRDGLGRFEIRGQLGHGGFGIVFLVFDPRIESRSRAENSAARDSGVATIAPAVSARSPGRRGARPPEHRADL